MTTVRYWDNGWRLGVLYYRGTKWARVLNIGTLNSLRIPVEETRDMQPCPIPDSRIAARLRKKSNRWRRLGVSYSQPAIKAALAHLEGEDA